jgi:predicted RNase H-like HicB family nuclease
MMSTITLKISAVVEPDESRFHGYCPALKGLHVDGDSVEQTIDRLKQGIDVYIQSLMQCGDPLPIGTDLTINEELDISSEAILRNLTIECPPTLQMCGAN